MTIRQKLRLSSIATIILVIVFIAATLFLVFTLQKSYQKQQFSQKITETSFQMALLRSEYFAHPSERPKTQWINTYEVLLRILDESAHLFTKTEEKVLFDDTRKAYNDSRALFGQLVQNIEQGGNEIVREELLNQLTVKAQTRVSDVLRLSLLSRTDADNALHIFELILIILGVLFALINTISYFITTSITTSLQALGEDFTKISALDFTTTTTTTTTGSKDEIGLLKRAFNTMVSKLKESYATLEQKVRDRTQNLENAKIAARNVLEDLQVEREKLAEAKAKDEAMLASIGDGCVVVDRKGKIMVMNERAATMLKLDKESVLGKDYRDIWSVADESGNIIPSERRPIQIVLTSGKKLTTTTYWYIRSDRTRFPVAITVAPILHEGAIEGVEGVILIFRDITREKEIDKTKSEFIATASHQLRTPLTGIRWVVERLLKTQKLSMEAMEYLGDIHASTERLANLVELLLNASRLEGGSMSITPKPLDAVEFLKEFFSECTPLAAKKDIKLLFKIYPKSLIVTTDQSAFRNIVQSLVSNAFEYTPEKGEVELALEKKDKTFLFTVRDTGIGIPKEEQAMIFEKFMRASNAKRVKTDGTGLGLYIAKQATEFLGGKIWFESAEGKGAKFFVELPLVSESKEGIKAFT